MPAKCSPTRRVITGFMCLPNMTDPPARLMVFQDGHAFVGLEGAYRMPNVFDNLIYRREMPVTIGVFINLGRTPDQQESSAKDWGDRINNRPTEYNELNDTYARMVIDELIPKLEEDYMLSDKPKTVPLRVPAQAPSVPLPWPGIGRMLLARSSPPSGVSRTFGAATSTRN